MDKEREIQLNNPLHGLKLKDLLQELVDHFGFEVLAQHININCFKTNPSFAASYKFLHKTEWAREKLEIFYLYKYKRLPKPDDVQYELPPRKRTIPLDHQPKEPYETLTPPKPKESSSDYYSPSPFEDVEEKAEIYNAKKAAEKVALAEEKAIAKKEKRTLNRSKTAERAEEEALDEAAEAASQSNEEIDSSSSETKPATVKEKVTEESKSATPNPWAKWEDK